MNLSTVTSITFKVSGTTRTADTMSIGGVVAWRRPLTLTLKKGTGISTIYYKIGSGSWTSASGSVSVGYGLTVYMYATASSGYTYNTYTQSNPLTVTMNGTYTYNPVGTLASFAVTLTKSFSGTLRWSGSVSGTSTSNSYTVNVPSGGSIQVWCSSADGWYHCNYNSGSKLSVSSAQTVTFTRSTNDITMNDYGAVIQFTSGGVSRCQYKKSSASTWKDSGSTLTTGYYWYTGDQAGTLRAYMPEGSNGSMKITHGKRGRLSTYLGTDATFYNNVKRGTWGDTGNAGFFTWWAVDGEEAYFRKSGTYGYGVQYVDSYIEAKLAKYTFTGVYMNKSDEQTYNFYNA